LVLALFPTAVVLGVLLLGQVLSERHLLFASLAATVLKLPRFAVRLPSTYSSDVVATATRHHLCMVERSHERDPAENVSN